ncbi:MAG TPA: pilus assembly protein TadG-related protein [Tepidisphaeraceae bacterium]|nr:pilus assembly protein TadG-related protein [Tepidisphaeraceae bacterium]
MQPSRSYFSDAFGANFVRPNRRHNGTALIYLIVAMTTLLLFASLAVDLGRAQLAKTELRRAADAAARYGAAGFKVDTSTVKNNAIAAAAANKVDEQSLVLQNSDITTGFWSNGTFSTSGTGTSAVRVTAKRVKSRNTGIPLLFAGILGRTTLDLTVQSYATYTPEVNVTITAQSKANPWLAGMPNGTTANDYDSAPLDSPSQVTGLSIVPGEKLNFDFSGGASYLPGQAANGPDGTTSFILYNHIYTGYNTGRENGFSNLTAPITAVVGVFLNDSQPNTQGAPPPDLDFSSDSSRDFSTLSPQLRQPFFIGDGMRADGVTPQDFIVPAGATRLYIGIMDGQQWSDNSGSFNTTVIIPSQVILVK